VVHCFLHTLIENLAPTKDPLLFAAFSRMQPEDKNA
jgi:hypothetical protein